MRRASWKQDFVSKYTDQDDFLAGCGKNQDRGSGRSQGNLACSLDASLSASHRDTNKPFYCNISAGGNIFVVRAYTESSKFAQASLEFKIQAWSHAHETSIVR
jgi:hypothetical protein